MLALGWLAAWVSLSGGCCADSCAAPRDATAAEPENLRLGRGSRAQAATGSSSLDSALSSAAAGFGTRRSATASSAPATAMPAAPRNAAE